MPVGNFQVVACGRINTDGTILGGRGFSCARNGAGDYTITLDQALDSLEGAIFLTFDTALIIGRTVHTSDTAKQILSITVAAGNAATDAVFDFMAVRFAP